jgi:hypothetical protein
VHSFHHAAGLQRPGKTNCNDDAGSAGRVRCDASRCIAEPFGAGSATRLSVPRRGTVPPVFSRVPRAPSAEADAGSVEGPAPEGRTEPAPRRRAARCGLRRPSPRRRCAGRPPPRVFQDTPDLNA